MNYLIIILAIESITYIQLETIIVMDYSLKFKMFGRCHPIIIINSQYYIHK